MVGFFLGVSVHSLLQNILKKMNQNAVIPYGPPPLSSLLGWGDKQSLKGAQAQLQDDLGSLCA